MMSNQYHEAEAKYQSHIAFAKRLESFEGWPNKNALQSPKNMALAGFFYIGSSDRARCFYCGLTLRDWDEDDEPFTVHKKWSPKCGYISHIAEQQLSSGIQSLHVTEAVRSGSSATVTAVGTHLTQISSDSRSTNFLQGQATTNTRDESTRAGDATSFGAAELLEVDHQMSDAEAETVPIRVWEHPPHVQAVLDMGYCLDDIKCAIDERRLAGEEDFTDASSLLRAVEGWT